jgi:hypothetical protein
MKGMLQDGILRRPKQGYGLYVVPNGREEHDGD